MKYIDKIFDSAFHNMIIASEKDNKEAFLHLLEFYLSKLFFESLNKTEEVFSKSLFYLDRVYYRIDSPRYKEVFIEKYVNDLIVGIYISNKTYYTDKLYNSLITLLKTLLKENNYFLFNKASKVIQDSSFSLKPDRDSEKSTYLYYFTITLLCWIYYLRFNNKDLFSHENYNLDFLNEVFEEDISNTHFINHYYKLYDAIDTGLWGIHNWDIKEAPIGVVYFPLMPNQWLPFSFVLLMLKYNNYILPSDYNDIILNRKHKHEVENIKSILSQITIEREDYIDCIFSEMAQSKEELISQLNYRKEKIIDLFTYLKKEIEITEYKDIRAVPLSNEKIEKFRLEVGRLWERDSIVVNILKYLKHVSYLSNIEDKKGFGYFVTFKKARFAFIDGKYHQDIHGIEHYGSNLARSLDNSFFRELLDKKEPIHSNNIDTCIDNFMECLQNKNNVVIFADWKKRELFKNVKFGHKDKFPHSNTHYKYQDTLIPIINPFTNYDDYIFVVDFSDIKINIFQSDSPKWYKKELLVDVTEYQKGDITSSKIQEWCLSDGYQYTSEEVDILESNNINIKVLCKNEFKFENIDSHLIINIVENN